MKPRYATFFSEENHLFDQICDLNERDRSLIFSRIRDIALKPHLSTPSLSAVFGDYYILILDYRLTFDIDDENRTLLFRHIFTSQEYDDLTNINP